MKYMAIIAVHILSVMVLCAETTELLSPSGDIGLRFEISPAGLTYAVDSRRKTVVMPSRRKTVVMPTRISLTIDGVEYPGSAGRILASQRLKKDGIVVPVGPAKNSQIPELYNELLIQVHQHVFIRSRAYNDCVAIRWETEFPAEEMTVNSERFDIAFSQNYNVYYPNTNGKEFWSHQESLFSYTNLAKAPKRMAAAPVLVDLGKDQHLLITDVNVESYPGLWFRSTGGLTLTGDLAKCPTQMQHPKEKNHTIAGRTKHLAIAKGTRQFPWRAFQISDSKGLLQSDSLYLLADSCRLKDTSWIKPGLAAWDWWHAWSIGEVGFKPGPNQATYKHYIDFAAEAGLPYFVIDSGWDGGGLSGLMSTRNDIDMSDLVQYGKERNVGIILWASSSALDLQFEKAFELFELWGIKGIKIDFSRRDDQLMRDFYYRTAKRAAQAKILIDFHGGSKPTGLSRTYPNVLTEEAVQGLEQSKWNHKANPDEALRIPFIRGVVGPMDYTPGAMLNHVKGTYKPSDERPGSMGTRCHQLAMYVAYFSPLQMLADSPEHYRKNPKSLEFLKSVPTAWDETRVLHAKVNSHLVMARRLGDTWYIGAMTNWEKRSITVNADFLGGGDYLMKSWSDGPKSSVDATDVAIVEKSIRKGQAITIQMESGGGYVAVIKRQERPF